ncbi:hypothetical protein ONZ51_g6416 [Trametes cubensis]|uniref:Uncharacterized protein n=1 Tax=Trametes cubensis TaxID=1111947 RepID=A0AAD7TUK2_9APHY|nr:hypothetical protein ONZ51_g6416 [Trametes cubensis]
MSSAILRQASSVARTATRSCAFSTSAVARRDFVQELYLKELKSYKAPPPAPVLPADLAVELSAYDSAEPTFAASAKPAESEESSGPTGADAFLAFLEADEPKAEAHH